LIVTTLEPHKMAGDTSDWFEVSTAEIFHLPRFLARQWWSDFLDYLIVCKQIDVLWVVGSAFVYDDLPSLIKRHPKVKVVDLLFNTFGHTENNRRHSDRISLTIVENQEVLSWLVSHGEVTERVKIIPSGVDLEAANHIGQSDTDILGSFRAKPDDFVYGFCGRWSEEKDPTGFVQIAKLLDGKAGLCGVMTGAGPLHEAVHQSVLQSRIHSDRFRLLGLVPDVQFVLRNLDLLLLPSRVDGRPVVVMEAMANGIPVIASNVGGLSELIEDGVTGFLCNPGDYASFVARVMELATNRPLHVRMKQAARAFAERCFDEKSMLQKYENTFSSLLG